MYRNRFYRDGYEGKEADGDRSRGSGDDREQTEKVLAGGHNLRRAGGGAEEGGAKEGRRKEGRRRQKGRAKERGREKGRRRQERREERRRRKEEPKSKRRRSGNGKGLQSLQSSSHNLLLRS